MKRIATCVAFALTTSSIALADTTPIVPPLHAPVVAPSFVPQGPLPPLQLMCPDPAAVRVDFSIVRRASRFAGRVRVAGTAKNVGGAPYVSGANQQLALLYEMVPGGRPRLVAQRAFQNLDPGAEVSLAYERDWNASSPAEGEFPPTYRLMITYDPDILLDGNPKNDDCVGGNNVRDRSGTEMNALFR